MKKLDVLIILLLLSTSAQCQFERTDSSSVDTFANGNPKKIVRVTTKNLKKYHLLEFYGDKKIEVKIFDSTGALLHERLTWTKRASYGKPCREMIHKQKTYWPNGNRKSSYVSKCDCHKVIFKKYNRSGKLMRKERTVVRRQEGITEEQENGEKAILK